MAAEPTFDQTITADGITVRLHRSGGKLTVEINDPVGAVRKLEIFEPASPIRWQPWSSSASKLAARASSLRFVQSGIRWTGQWSTRFAKA